MQADPRRGQFSTWQKKYGVNKVMKYTKLGNSGIEVSKLCVGCMSFGKPFKDFHEWTLNPDETEEVVRHALNLGINFLILQIPMHTEQVRNISGAQLRTMLPVTRLFLRQRCILTTGICQRKQ